jgi:hypothetical protein
VQEGTSQETFSSEQYHTLNVNMLKDCKVTEATCRDHAMLTNMFNGVGRSYDARLMFISDLIQPTKLRCVGESLATLHKLSLSFFWLHSMCKEGHLPFNKLAGWFVCQSVRHTFMWYSRRV